MSIAGSKVGRDLDDLYVVIGLDEFALVGRRPASVMRTLASMENPLVLLGEHVCGGSGVEQSSKPEPPHNAAPVRAARSAAVIDRVVRNTGGAASPCRNTPSVTHAHSSPLKRLRQCR